MPHWSHQQVPEQYLKNYKREDNHEKNIKIERRQGVYHSVFFFRKKSK